MQISTYKCLKCEEIQAVVNKVSISKRYLCSIYQLTDTKINYITSDKKTGNLLLSKNQFHFENGKAYVMFTCCYKNALIFLLF